MRFDFAALSLLALVVAVLLVLHVVLRVLVLLLVLVGGILLVLFGLFVVFVHVETHGFLLIFFLHIACAEKGEGMHTKQNLYSIQLRLRAPQLSSDCAGP